MSRLGLVVLFVVLVSFCASAGRVGVVVQYSPDKVETRCVDFSDDATAADVLASAGFAAEIYNDPTWGKALCGIDGVGCPASNCFCDASNYWGFYYSSGNSWQYSGVGIGSFDDNGYRIVQDGKLIGFRWGGFGVLPPAKSFSEVCPPLGGAAQNSPSRILNLTLDIVVDCEGKAHLKTADEEGRVVPFSKVHVTKYVPLIRVEKVGDVFTDGDGEGSVQLEIGGPYTFDAFSLLYLPVQKEIWVEPCKSVVNEQENETVMTANATATPTPLPPEKVEVVFVKRFIETNVGWEMMGLSGWGSSLWSNLGMDVRRPR